MQDAHSLNDDQGWIMPRIFNYTTIDVELLKKSRTLQITFNENSQYIGLEVLFELESILAWSTSKVEIHSILICSKEGELSKGINLDSLPQLKESQLQKITSKLQKITHALFHLPQTVVIDLGMGANNIAAELAIGADIRVAHINTKVQFDHIYHGLVPCSGGMGMLNTTVGNTFSKNWILLGDVIPTMQLIHSGFLFQTYEENREQTITNLLNRIHLQSPVQRVQAKMGLFQGVRDSIEKATEFERQVGKAARISQDWKEKRQHQMPAKSMSKAVKLSLVKNKSSETIN